jgi:1-acyl-sn-glycerol-3-phosphate acyltransferase
MKVPLLASAVKILTRVDVRGLCQVDTRQRIYFANHTSHLDTLVLWAALPSKLRDLTRPAAAKDYWAANKLRLYLATSVFNAVLIERMNVKKSNNPLQAVLQALGDRHSLILFPEGKRNPGPDLGEFKSGLYHIARSRPDLELVPVYIKNVNRILPKGRFFPVPSSTCVTFGAPLKLTGNETKAAFLKRAREAISGLQSYDSTSD